ncbi:hypothetical protein F6476_24360 [Pseudomonas umsongensis]|nr:hypothetical protein F6476_24360 [Pseudomonas umsongensis]
MWERACSRKRLQIQQPCCLKVRIREQARSHICSAQSLMACFYLTHRRYDFNSWYRPRFAHYRLWCGARYRSWL